MAVCVNIRVFLGKNYAVALIYVRMHVKLLCKGEKLLYHPWVKLGCIKGFARNGIVYYRAAVVYYRPLHAHGLPYIGRAVEAAARGNGYEYSRVLRALYGVQIGLRHGARFFGERIVNIERNKLYHCESS